MLVNEIECWVREFICTSFLTEGDVTFQNTDELFTLLDSLQVLRLIVQLEKQFGIKVADDELSIENLGSVARIAAFVARKYALSMGAEAPVGSDLIATTSGQEGAA